MQPLNLTMVISNANEHRSADRGAMNSSDVHRVTLTDISWISGNMFVLINEKIRKLLHLGFCKTLPPHYISPKLNNIIPSRGPYKLCEVAYLSMDTVTYRPRSLIYPVLIPDLSVDFVLGRMYFDELNLKWDPRLQSFMVYNEEEETARQTYRRIL